MIKSIYIEKKEAILAIAKELQRKSRILLLAKLITFCLFAYLGWMYLTSDYLASYGLSSLGALVVYASVMISDGKLQKKLRFYQHKLSVVDKELAYLEKDFSAFGTGEEYLDPEHPFSYDLDVFGEHSFFHRINRTISEVGKDKLASYLSGLNLSQKEIVNRSESLKELSKLDELRLDFQTFGEDASFDLKRLLNEKLKHTTNSSFTGTGAKIILLLFPIVTICTLLLSVFNVLPGSIAGFLVALQILICILFSKVIMGISAEIGGLFKGFSSYRNIFELIENQKFESVYLKRIQASLFPSKEASVLRSFGKLARILDSLDQRANLVVFILSNGFYLRDLWLIRSYFIWKQYSFQYLEQWVEALAEFDALVSLATYAYNQPECNYAEIVEADGPVFRAEACYHPFINRDKAVANSFDLELNDFAIVTGANMAGKSTFLRSVGLNAILALNGIPVCAEKLTMSVVMLFSSMRTSDNLVKNMSYFNAELTRLGNLITYCKSNKHTLIILDEILKGTNSKDKLNGSRLFLSEISKLPVTGIIATHDLALADLSEQDKRFVNYCFEIELSDNIEYTYKISSGVARNMNATHLLTQIIRKIDA